MKKAANKAAFFVLSYFLVLGLKINAFKYPKNMAAAMPPAVAVMPPAKMPVNPSSRIIFCVPVAKECPNPVNGIVAPAPAKSTKGWYSPTADKTTPATT